MIKSLSKLGCAAALASCLPAQQAPDAEAPRDPAQDRASWRVERFQRGAAQWVRREVRANAFTASDQDHASVAVAPDGQVLVVWQSRRQLAGKTGVFARRLDAAGRRTGEEFALGAATEHHQTGPSIAFDPSGRPIAVWEAFGQDGYAGAVMRRAVGGEPEATVHRSSVGDQRSVAIASLRNGRHIVVWQHAGEDKVVQLRHRVFGADQQPVGGERTVASGLRHERVDQVSVAAMPDGGYLLAWSVTAEATGIPAGLRTQAFDRDGKARGVARAVHAVRPSGAIEPRVAGGPDGAVLTWMDCGRGAAGYDVMALRLAADGAPLGDPITVCAAESGENGADVAVAHDGRFAVAWNRLGSDDHHDVFVQCFDRDAVAVGEAFRVHGHTTGEQAIQPANGRPSMAYGRDGQLVIAWNGDAHLGDRNGVHVTTLLPAGSALAAKTGGGHETGCGGGTVPATAGPHDPPVFTGPVKQLPGGGDPSPEGLVDRGFLGITFTGWRPPDPHIAAGPNHVVSMTNGGIAFHRKADGVRTFFQTISGSAGFWGAQGATRFVFDPKCVFDPHTDRFVMMAVERTVSSGSGRSVFCLAISDDEDPNGTWLRWRFDVTTVGGSGGIDFPHLGVDEQGVYLTANMFNQSPVSHLTYILDKAKLLQNQVAATFVKNRSVLSASMGIQHAGAGAPLLVQAAGSGRIRLWAIRNPLTTPSMTSVTLTVNPYSSPSRAPSLGSSINRWTVDNRIWGVMYRNGSMWAAHHHGNPTKARWYEIKTNGWPASGTPTVRQQGDVDLGANLWAYFNNIAVDAYGNAAMTFARSGPSERISIARAYRKASDPLGTMPMVEITKASSSAYSDTNRWGDYSGMAVDPCGLEFWYTHEYAVATNRWNTWIATVRVQDPTLTSDVTSLSASAGGTVTFSLDNPANAGQAYVLLPSASGSTPGTLLPGSTYKRLPLNIDGLTLGAANALNTPTFNNFLGTLDASGKATARFVLPPIGVLAGRTFTFAYAQNGNDWNFASDPVDIALTR